jgi:hypothetical protein
LNEVVKIVIGQELRVRYSVPVCRTAATPAFYLKTTRQQSLPAVLTSFAKEITIEVYSFLPWEIDWLMVFDRIKLRRSPETVWCA